MLIGETVHRRLDATDMAIRLTVGKDTFTSNYEIYAFKGQKNQALSVLIKSYCYNDCAGVKKYNMLPLVYVFNKSGRFLTMPIRSYENKKEFKGLGYYFFIQGKGELQLPETGAYYILVASDNRVSGKEVKKIYIPNTEFIFPAGYAVRGYPFGEFYLQMRTKK